LTLQSVRVRTARRGGLDGQIRVSAVLDVTALGGVDGLRAAQHQRLAVGVNGAGLAGPETIVFPPWCGVVPCDGRSAADGHISFLRIGASNRFRVRITLSPRAIVPPLASAPVTVSFSLGGSDRQATTHACRVGGRGTRATCR